MNTPYSIGQLLAEKEFSECMKMTTANVQKLMLGSIQSKRYFESIARLRQNKDDKLSWVTVYKYHKKIGSRL